MAEEEKSMVADGGQDDPIREKAAAFCLEGTMMERARNSGVGDGDLHDPRALAVEQLLTCSLVTEETKQFYMIDDRQLVVAFIQACANVPCLAAAVWPLIESLGDDQDALAMVDWVGCAKLRPHPTDTTKPWFRWIVGVPDMEGNTGLMALGISDIHDDVVDRYGEACNPRHASNDTNTALAVLYAHSHRPPYRPCTIWTAISNLITAFNVNCGPGQVNKDGNTVLMIACHYICRDIVPKLIATFGVMCKPEQINEAGDTALMLACKHRHFASAAALIESFGNTCSPGHINGEGKTALMLAVSTHDFYDGADIASSLIAQFGRLGVACAPEHVNDDGDTALMLACKHRHFASAAALIETFGEACNPGHVNGEGETALMMALSTHGHCAHRRGADSPSSLIAQFGRLGVACAPGHVNGDGDTALTLACKYKRFASAAALMETFGDACNPGHINGEGKTALIMAVSPPFYDGEDGSSSLIAQFGRLGVACTLNDDGDTALMLACKHRHFTSAAALIETFGGACNPGHVNEEGKTALMLAVSTHRGADKASSLVAHFCRLGVACAPEHVNDDGDTAFMLACKSARFTSAAVLIETFGTDSLGGYTGTQLSQSFRQLPDHKWHQRLESALHLAQLALTVTEIDSFRLDVLRACTQCQCDLASTLVSGISRHCRPEQLRKIVRELRQRWGLPDWTPVLLAILAKLLELGCSDFPFDAHKEAVKCRVMELAMKNDEDLTLRLLGVLTPLTNDCRQKLLSAAKRHWRLRVVDRLCATGKTSSSSSPGSSASSSHELKKFLRKFASCNPKPDVYLTIRHGTLRFSCGHNRFVDVDEMGAAGKCVMPCFALHQPPSLMSMCSRQVEGKRGQQMVTHEVVAA